MDECIEREAAIKAIYESDPNGIRQALGFNIGQIEEAMRAVPAADVAPVRHGRWIDNGACGYKWAFSCSKCGYIDGYPFNDRHNYCPNCGAKMEAQK